MSDFDLVPVIISICVATSFCFFVRGCEQMNRDDDAYYAGCVRETKNPYACRNKTLTGEHTLILPSKL